MGCQRITREGTTLNAQFGTTNPWAIVRLLPTCGWGYAASMPQLEHARPSHYPLSSCVLMVKNIHVIASPCSWFMKPIFRKVDFLYETQKSITFHGGKGIWLLSSTVAVRSRLASGVPPDRKDFSKENLGPWRIGSYRGSNHCGASCFLYSAIDLNGRLRNMTHTHMTIV